MQGESLLHAGRNSNSKINELNCSGFFGNNSNCNLFCKDSGIQVSGNSNCNLHVFNSTSSKISDNSNGLLNWIDSCLTIQGNSNSDIQAVAGKGNSKFIGNSNLRFSGFGFMGCIFRGNSNTCAELSHGGIVTADNNSNLKISGGVQNLEVRNTGNHEIISVSETERNQFEVVNQERGIISRFLGMNSLALSPQNLAFKINYFKKAQINGSHYAIGDFKWKIERKGNNQILMKLDDRLSSSEIKHRQIQENCFELSKASSPEAKLQVVGPTFVSRDNNDDSVLIIGL